MLEQNKVSVKFRLCFVATEFGAHEGYSMIETIEEAVGKPECFGVDKRAQSLPGGFSHQNDSGVCLSARSSNNNGWLRRTVNPQLPIIFIISSSGSRPTCGMSLERPTTIGPSSTPRRRRCLPENDKFMILWVTALNVSASETNLANSASSVCRFFRSSSSCRVPFSFCSSDFIPSR